MEKLIEKARKAFIPHQASQQSAVSFLGYVYDDGFVMSNNTACHASMQYPPRPDSSYGVFEDGEEPEDDDYYEDEDDHGFEDDEEDYEE